MDKEKYFWDARRTARDGLVGCLMIFLLGKQTVTTLIVEAGGFSTSFLVHSCLGLVLAYCALSQLWRETAFKQMTFNFAISALTSSLLCSFCFMAFKGFEGENEEFDNTLKMRFFQGELPLAARVFLCIPLYAVPAGMSYPIARFVTLFNVGVYLLTMYAVFNMRECSSVTTEESGLVTWVACSSSPLMASQRERVSVLIHDALITFLSLGMAYNAIVPSMKVSEEYIGLLRAGRLADSVLNHIVKNSIAGASVLLEIVLQDTNVDTINDNNTVSATSCCTSCLRNKKRVQEALEQLHHTMQWCLSRQVMMDLASGDYKSALTPTPVASFLARMLALSRTRNGDDEGGGDNCVKVHDSTAKQLSNGGAGLMFDSNVAQVAFENGLVNAVAHGDGSGSIEVGASFKRVNADTDDGGGSSTTDDQDSQEQQGVLELSITNHIHPESKLTDSHL
jgi:hypothetical protein